MDIPNLSESNPVTPNSKFSLSLITIIVFLGLGLGFWLSRLNTSTTNSSNTDTAKSDTKTNQIALSTDDISNAEQLQVGKLYGNTSKSFTDSATGTIEKGNINGEGTHILNRPGGASQRASLTSSTVDLDLFIGKNVEVKGETNRSNKTSWLMDVGSIKILE